MAHVTGEVFQGNNQEEMNNIEGNDLAKSTREQLGETHKTRFMQDFAQGITIEESRKKVHAKIDSLWSK